MPWVSHSTYFTLLFRARLDSDSNPGCHGGDPSALLLSYPAIRLLLLLAHGKAAG